MNKTIVRLAAVLCVIGMTAASTAEKETDDRGVTVFVTPDTVGYGGGVVITGATAADMRSKNRTVTLRFTPPEGAPFSRKTELDGEMRYRYELSPLLAAGEWDVTVTGPVKELGRVTAGFIVVPSGAFTAGVIRAAGEVCRDGASFSKESFDTTRAFTALPEKDAALEHMSTLQQDFGDFGEVLLAASAEMDTLRSVMDDLVYFPEVQTAMNELSAELAGHRGAVESLARSLEYTREEMNNTREWCRLFHFQKLGWNFCIDILQAAFAPASTLGGYAKGKLKDALKSAANKAADTAAMERIGLTAEEIARVRSAVGKGKTAAEHIEYLIEEKGKLTKIKVDGAAFAARWLVDWVYSKAGRNCRMYQADFTGRLHVEYYTKGVVYMTAGYPVSGEMKIFFQKREAETDIVKLKGQVQGKHGWRTGSFYPERTGQDIPGLTGIGLCIPQRPSELGIYLHFNIPIEGEGKPDYLELEFGKPFFETARLGYRYVAVLWSPYHIVPTVDFPKMDVPGAEWFFTRAAGTAGDKKTFSLPLVVDGDTVIVEHTFDRVMDYVREREFKATLVWKIKGKEAGI